MLAPVARSPYYPWEPGSAAGGEDSATATLLQEKKKDIINHDMVIATPDAPSPSPPPQPTVDVAIASISHGSLHAEHLGEYSSCLRGRHDIV
jgi:hypothetical protein